MVRQGMKRKDFKGNAYKRGAFCMLFCVMLLLFLLLPARAATTKEEPAAEGEELSDEIKKEWQDFLDSIPPEVAEKLPDGFFAGDMTAVGDTVREAGSLSAILTWVGELLGLSLQKNARLFAGICGLLLLSAILRGLTDGYGRSAEVAFSVCSAVILFGMILGREGGDLAAISAYFDTVSGLSAALIPLMGVLYAMGGNIGAAVANGSVMSAFLAVLETVCSSSVVPVGGLCLLMALSDAVTAGTGLRSLSFLIKRSFTWGLSLLMLLLCGVLGLQTTLAKGADTLALRTLRFAAGSFLPVVGGSLSEALRTVSGSVTYLRGAVGAGGILVILFTFLPMFLSVLCTRLVFLLSGAVAGMLSCSKEEKLLGECSAVWGYFLAVIASLFVMMVFSLNLLAGAATAI